MIGFYMLAIEIQNLTMEFFSEKRKKKQVLTDLNLQVSCGGIFGFLGHNGAGKTTTIKILMGLCHPCKGWTKILGLSSESSVARKPVGFLPEEPSFYDHLTAYESLISCCILHDISYQESKKLAMQSLENIGLKEAAFSPIFTFSKGMKQRLAIAHASVHNPRILILDEPMSGLDPEARCILRKKMLSWKDEGKTLFFSSHILSDVETLCDEVAFLSKGKLIASGAAQNFLKKQPTCIHILLNKKDFSMQEIPFPLSFQEREQEISILLKEEDSIEKMKDFLQRRRIFPKAWIPQYETLEECYFRLMKGQNNEDSCH